MVKFVSTRSYLIPLTCTSTNFPHYILRTETKSPSAKDQRIYHILTKYLYALWNYQINLLVSLWFLLCLFCCHLGRICDLYFRQKYWKSFYSCDNNILFDYDILQGIQQATSISFFPFVGYQSGSRKKTHFALLGSRSEHRFLARSPNIYIKIGKTCQQKWEFLTPESRGLRFLDYVWKRNLVNDTINYSGFFKRFGTSIQLLAKLATVIVDGDYSNVRHTYL